MGLGLDLCWPTGINDFQVTPFCQVQDHLATGSQHGWQLINFTSKAPGFPDAFLSGEVQIIDQRHLPHDFVVEVELI